MKATSEWFVSWFDTPYYHILYKHRDYKEAQNFIKNIVSFLNLKYESTLLDLGCGKGRHAIYLNSLGFHVTGVDLSKNSIAIAKKYENKTLHFLEHDMRNPLLNKYDAIFNLFTSFGFFEEDETDIKVLKNIKKALKPNGIAVIDFMNSKKVIHELIEQEVQTINNITFNIHRYIENGFIIKKILIEDKDTHTTYIEKVKILPFEKIKYFAESVGFKIKHTFGNYQLQEFDEKTSDRLILILK